MFLFFLYVFYYMTDSITIKRRPDDTTLVTTDDTTDGTTDGTTYGTTDGTIDGTIDAAHKA